MGRGQTAEVGATRTSANGYHYTKTKDRGWVLTHWLTAEAKIGRQIGAEEQVRFKDPKNRDPYEADNIIVIAKRKGSLRSRKAVVEARIAEYQAELDEINKALGDIEL